MGISTELEAILSKVEELNDNDKLTLVHKINSSMHSSKKSKLTDLKGLGADIWKNIDIDEYVSKERQW